MSHDALAVQFAQRGLHCGLGLEEISVRHPLARLLTPAKCLKFDSYPHTQLLAQDSADPHPEFSSPDRSFHRICRSMPRYTSASRELRFMRRIKRRAFSSVVIATTGLT